MPKIKAILFDMDGVLIEAKDWHYNALNQALALFGYKISYSQHLLDYDGLPTLAKLKRLTLEQGLPQQLHSFINQMKQQYTVSYIYKYCRPSFNHEYALAKLKSEGYKLACCSNSVRKSIEMMMGYAKLDKYLELILSNQDVTQAKPAPEIYLKAMEKLGLSPQECLILEDNENGIKAALASGAHLLQIEDVSDVNYSNIKAKIKEVEAL